MTINIKNIKNINPGVYYTKIQKLKLKMRFSRLCLYIQNKNTFKAIELIKTPDRNINIYCGCGQTPLILACKSNNIDIVRQLLKRDNILVNLQDLSGKSALMCCKDIKIFKELLSRPEILVNLQDSLGQTILYKTANNNSIEFVRELLKRNDVDKSLLDYKMYGNLDPMTALQISKIFGNIEISQMIRNYNP